MIGFSILFSISEDGEFQQILNSNEIKQFIKINILPSIKSENHCPFVQKLNSIVDSEEFMNNLFKSEIWFFIDPFQDNLQEEDIFFEEPTIYPNFLIGYYGKLIVEETDNDNLSITKELNLVKSDFENYRAELNYQIILSEFNRANQKPINRDNLKSDYKVEEGTKKLTYQIDLSQSVLHEAQSIESIEFNDNEIYSETTVILKTD